MPREYIHWNVLERSLSTVDSKIMESRPLLAAAYIGAMFPDISDYYWGGAGEKGEAISTFLHGVDGNDTFEIVRQLVVQHSMAKDSQKPILRAFIYGYLSHIAVDVTFHPLVLHLCGDWYSESAETRVANRSQHRLLETYLDVWAFRTGTFSFPGGLRETRKVLDKEAIKAICSAATIAIRETSTPEELPELTPSFWLTAIKHAALLQNLFRSRIAGVLLEPILRGTKSEHYLALFHSAKKPTLEWIQVNRDYQSVISGEWHSTSLDALLDQSLSLTTEWMIELRAELEEQRPSSILMGVGPSLDCGEPNISRERYRYFSTSPIDFPGGS